VLQIRKLKSWKRQLWGSKWDRWVATNIHLDHSSSLRKQWSPLRGVPPSVELGPWWAVLQSLMCPVMVGSMVEGVPHWTINASEGMEECCAPKNCWQWEPEEPHFSRGREAVGPTDYTTPTTVKYRVASPRIRSSSLLAVPPSYNIKPFTDKVLCDVTPLDVCWYTSSKKGVGHTWGNE